MIEAFDQLFVLLKHWLVSFVPAALQPLASVVLSIVPILMVFPGLFAFMTIMERKGLGRIQNRLGPNRVGPYGLFQPIADGIKSLIKENIIPLAADKLLYTLAPILLLIPALLAFSVIPYGRNMTPIDIDGGVLFFFAVGAASEVSIFMAGWSSHNKYSILGAMRAIAQMVSYEVPLILSAIPVIMMTGTLSTTRIVDLQVPFYGLLPNWHVFTPWGLAGFFLFVISATAESNRSPFDLPEGESEIIAGYFVEYSGFKFALFFLAEYMGLFAVTGLAITLFLGGWGAPFSFLSFVPSYIWFFSKFVVFMLFFIWIRGTLPRLRMDQLMNFAWKFMVPMALINIMVTGLWRFMTPNIGRWVVSLAILVSAYVLLGRGLAQNSGVGKRVYRYGT